jgi:hypothetical protein
LGANNRAMNNAVGTGLNFANFGGVLKVVGAFLLAGTYGWCCGGWVSWIDESRLSFFFFLS